MDSNDTSSPPDAHPYAVLRNRDLLLYLVGRFIAALGQQMVTVAVGWELYERTGSALALGLVGLTQMVPMILFTLPAGHVADNFDRRKIVLLMTVALGFVSLGLMLASFFKAPVFWTYACLFGAGTARTFLWPASSSFLPSLVSREQFSRAVTWSTGSFQLSSVAGPALGGALIAFLHNATAVYLINAIAAFTCFSLVLAIWARRETVQREKLTFKSLGAGFHFVFQQRIVLGTITLDLFATLFGGATALLPVYAKDILHAGPSGLGLLQAAMPVGSFICSMYLAHRPPLQKAGKALLWSVIVFGIATIAFGLSRSFWFSMAMLLLCGAVDNISVVVRHTLVQLLTPDEKRGRVSAVNSLFIGTSNEMGGFESGAVAQWMGPVFSVVSGGVGTLVVVAAIALAWPEIRRYGKLGT
jgi:MFS family permease